MRGPTQSFDTYHPAMTWPLLFGLMLVSAGVAWYSVAVFIPLLHAKAARPAAITIAGALSLVAVLAKERR